MLIIQAYTSTYMPYKICFIDTVLVGFDLVFEYILDSLFIVEILVNFISIKVISEKKEEKDLKLIAKQYLKSTFILDVACSFPSQIFELIIEDTNNTNS